MPDRKDSAAPPAFLLDRGNRYIRTIPLSADFRFVHEPTTFRENDSAPKYGNRSCFVGREDEVRVLTQRILLSNGGAFLVTGYRGVGKTSFVNRVIGEIRSACASSWARSQFGPVDVVDIHLNLAREVTPGELMHHIVRSLYTTLADRGLLTLLDRPTHEALGLAFQRTSINLTRRMAATQEYSVGVGQLGVPVPGLAAQIGLNATRAKAEGLDLQYMPLDDKAAEYDLIQLASKIAAGYVRPQSLAGRIAAVLGWSEPERVRLKVIFVFDEMDKVEAIDNPDRLHAIDEVLRTLKNLFTTSGLTFIFVAGQDLHERWRDDLGRGDSVYESVFAYNQYLPAMWENVGQLCDVWSPGDARRNEDYEQFVRFLAFRGRGLPRSILRAFNQYVRWGEQAPYLAFSALDWRKVKFYATLQGALQAQERKLIGEAREENPGERVDKARLAIYYLTDWVLQRGERPFTAAELATACRRLSPKIAPPDEQVDEVVQGLIEALCKIKYLEEVAARPDEVIIHRPSEPTAMRYSVPRQRIIEMGGPDESAADESAVSGPERADSADERRVGHYRLVGLLGRGGMSEVYRGWDEANARDVAVKLLVSPLASDRYIHAKFIQEGELLLKLRHDNVVRCYEYGSEGDRDFIALELIDGLSLAALLHDLGKLEVDQALAVIEPVLQAVAYVHKCGIRRLDLKPANIMIDRRGKVRLIDLGIARLTRPGDDTTSTQIIGTPLYMAPEQAMGRDVDGRVDIYAAGVVLYQTLAGVLPFEDRRDGFDVLSAVLNEAPRPLSQVNPKVPRRLADVVMRCLAKNPAERYQTADDVLLALPRGGRPDLAPLVSRGREREQRRSEREREATMVASPAVVAAVPPTVPPTVYAPSSARPVASPASRPATGSATTRPMRPRPSPQLATPPAAMPPSLKPLETAYPLVWEAADTETPTVLVPDTQAWVEQGAGADAGDTVVVAPPAAVRRGARLLIEAGPRAGQSLPLPASGSMRLGRSAENAVSFDSPK